MEPTDINDLVFPSSSEAALFFFCEREKKLINCT